MASQVVRGRRILVVEDEYFIADELRLAFEKMGASVLGPVATAEAALELISSQQAIDGATLDVALRGGQSTAVAEMLFERGVPFVLLTGLDEDALPEPLRQVPCCQKPVNVQEVLSKLFMDDASH
ncbi:response regulator [Jiella avicenniae]|uniref:Response regulator n=1 Tax=Jiella avicenniae TaxID=2907202 RepID=A0A9X1P3J6_9HYPH|nr:response regulator [Jiella avicenniae]MCE7029660.1 response regulator [Jiella avicenniae]